jgi:hypothetical protein
MDDKIDPLAPISYEPVSALARITDERNRLVIERDNLRAVTNRLKGEVTSLEKRLAKRADEFAVLLEQCKQMGADLVALTDARDNALKAEERLSEERIALLNQRDKMGDQCKSLSDDLGVAKTRRSEAEDRLFDMLLADDGEAWFQAERYLKEHRPDLYDRLEECKGEQPVTPDDKAQVTLLNEKVGSLEQQVKAKAVRIIGLNEALSNAEAEGLVNKRETKRLQDIVERLRSEANAANQRANENERLLKAIRKITKVKAR